MEPLTEQSQLDLEKRLAKAGIGKIKKHLFLCAGDKCCAAVDGEKTWEWLKQRSRSEDFAAAGLFRSKALCLRVCQQGPIALVYPDGTWYRNVTPEVCERIVTEHLLGGIKVAENIIAENPP